MYYRLHLRRKLPQRFAPLCRQFFSDYCRQRRIRFQETSIAEAMSTEIPDTLMCRRGSHLTMKYAEASPITDFKPYLDATGEQMRYLAAEG